MKMIYKTVVILTMIISVFACDDESGGTNPLSPISAQYGIYGAMAGDYKLTYVNHTLIATSDKQLFDAIGLDSSWVNSSPGDEYAHYSSNVNPTNSSWQEGESYIEGSPDGFTIENTVGQESYYSFSTMRATTMIVYVK